MKRTVAWLVCLSTVLMLAPAVFADPISEASETAIADVDNRAKELKEVNQSIWKFAEVGLKETRSSGLLLDKLEAAGFKTKSGIAGMPTAFVASYGSGKPIIGILAEYDALPGMSQKVAPLREAAEDGAPGHACGHSGLGTGALGAALAVKTAMQKHNLPGTIRLYGTPAEETVIGKVYMTLDGAFDDLDICLHWHPSTRNEAWASSSKALVSAKFTFHGTPSHASVSPESGRSALDAVELMNIGANYMREHLKEDARLHYVTTDGGGAPNVVPPKATVWYFCRADSHKDVEYNFRWLKDVAAGAANQANGPNRHRLSRDRSQPPASRVSHAQPQANRCTAIHGPRKAVRPPPARAAGRAVRHTIRHGHRRTHPSQDDRRGALERLDRRGRHKLAGSHRRPAHDLHGPRQPRPQLAKRRRHRLIDRRQGHHLRRQSPRRHRRRPAGTTPANCRRQSRLERANE